MSHSAVYFHHDRLGHFIAHDSSGDHSSLFHWALCLDGWRYFNCFGRSWSCLLFNRLFLFRFCYHKNNPLLARFWGRCLSLQSLHTSQLFSQTPKGGSIFELTCYFLQSSLKNSRFQFATFGRQFWA